MALKETIESNLLKILPEGRYEITRLLGVGASGQVFAGRDRLNATPVVLKLLHLGNREAQARTDREIALLKKLAASPHIVSLIDGILSPDAKAAVLISQYFEGPTLQSLVEGYRRGLPNAVAAAIARQLCHGLEYLHEQGVIHRDIKPSNVLITNEGVVKLLDFGIAVSTAKDGTEDSDITKVGSFVGTMRYASPEMVSGQSYGPALDIYALGVTTMFMILGRQPFESASVPFLVNQVLQGAFIKELPESLQSAWGHILSATLDARPEIRPSATQLLAMLQRAFPSEGQNDSAIVADFLLSSGGFREPPPNPRVALSSAPEPEDDKSLKGAVQSLAAQILEVQAAVADMTATFKQREPPQSSLIEGHDPYPVTYENRIEATFMTVRRRLELNWRMSLVMTLALFSLFVAMLVLAVVFSVIYQKSFLGIVFGGTSALSLLTVVLWKPMDKMLFSTIATQQLELIQLNYQRALSGNREERREAFRDVSTQLNSLLTKISTKSRS